MNQNDLMDEARDLLIEALGKQSAFWGFGKATGEIFGVLYISPTPLTLGEIAEILKVTKGNVSVAIRNLERLGMVRRSWRKGDRKVYFEAETDFWRITRTVLDQRQKPEFDHSFGLVEKSLNLASQSLQKDEKNEIIIRRLSNLVQFYHGLDILVAALLKLDPAQLPALAALLTSQVSKEYPQKVY